MMRTLRFVVVALTLNVTLSGCAARSRPSTFISEAQLAVKLTASCPASDPSGTPAPCGDLGALDKFFMDAYEAAQEYTKAPHQPVVVVAGSGLVLVREGEKDIPARVIPDLYHALKAVAHFPFAVYLTLDRETAGRLPPTTRSTLEAFLKQEPRARADFARFTLSPTQATRQHRILDIAVWFIRKTLDGDSVTRAQLDAFARSVGPLLLENTRDAGCAQVLSTHRQMLAWRKAYPSVDWASLVVMNRGAHQARFRNAATLYFAWLIGDRAPNWNYPGESFNVVYAEDIFLPVTPPPDYKPPSLIRPAGVPRAMDAFTNVALDAPASRAFFGDAWRLSEDVLSEGAARCVAGLPKSQRWKK
jgi:hypothetical protein